MHAAMFERALTCCGIPTMQASAMTRLDSLVKQVLLGGSGRWPGLLFRCGTAAAHACSGGSAQQICTHAWMLLGWGASAHVCLL